MRKMLQVTAATDYRCGGIGTSTVAVARGMSERAVGHERSTTWRDYWGGENMSPSYPSSMSEHPILKLRKTHVEWRTHHGHGARLGSYGPTREIADFEYSDGTPAPVSRRRWTFSHHQDHLLVQVIKAAAAVEVAASRNLLPRVPGTQEQRDWDPEIPLFLDDLDEHGQAPIAHYTGPAGDGAANKIRSEKTRQKVDGRFVGVHNKHQSINMNQPGGETLEPITMFASYDPAAFVREPLKPPQASRPLWSRRRWALTNEFLIPRNPKAKNTIKDE